MAEALQQPRGWPWRAKRAAVRRKKSGRSPVRPTWRGAYTERRIHRPRAGGDPVPAPWKKNLPGDFVTGLFRRGSLCVPVCGHVALLCTKVPGSPRSRGRREARFSAHASIQAPGAPKHIGGLAVRTSGVPAAKHPRARVRERAKRVSAAEALHHGRGTSPQPNGWSWPINAETFGVIATTSLGARLRERRRAESRPARLLPATATAT